MSSGSISLRDKIKLVYAYVITPIIMILSAGGQKMSELYSKYGYDIALEESLKSAFTIGLMSYYLPLIFPPTIIRFLFPRQELNDVEDLYCTLLFSLMATLLMTYLLTGTVVSSGLWGALAVYCVLSYGAKGTNTIPRVQRYILTAVTLIAPFLIAYMQSNPSSATQSIYFPLGEAIILSIILNSQVSTPNIAYQRESNETREQPITSSGSNDNQTAAPEETQVEKLVNIGLASIGRKTKKINKYMTNERLQSRRKAEKHFLKILSERYRDEGHRKILSRHFMLFKEMLLFISYGAILRDKVKLHGEVKTELTAQLSEGLTDKVLEWRNEYWRLLTKNFYEEYGRTQQLEGSLSYSFWKTVGEKYSRISNEGSLIEHSSEMIFEVFRYIYKSLNELSLN